jgi:hypothetical protein
MENISWKIFGDGLCQDQVNGHGSCMTHNIEKSKKPGLPQIWTRESGIFESHQLEFRVNYHM